MAGLKPKPNNGHGLMMLLRGKDPQNWRDGALVEHKAQQKKGKNNKTNTAGIGVSNDPDLDGGVTAAKRNGFDPAFTPYDALRTKKWLYVGLHQLQSLS